VFQTAIEIHEEFAARGSSCVLFGTNTNREQLGEAVPAEVLAPVHFTVEYRDPLTGLSVGRTYFLTRNAQQFRELQELVVPQEETLILDLVYELRLEQSPRFEEEDLLLRLYWALIGGLQQALRNIAKNYKKLTPQACQEAIWEAVAREAKPGEVQPEHLAVSLLAYNAMAEEVKIDFKESMAFILTPYFYVLRAKLSHVSLAGKDLGAIVFAESFALQEGFFLGLTSQTQNLDFWLLDNTHSSKVERMKHYPRFEEMGNPLSMEHEYSQMIFAHPEPALTLPAFKVRLFFYPQGLRICDSKLGWYLLLYSAMRSVRLISKHLKSQWLVFELDQPVLGTSLGYR
jgi:hypothetical protein